MAARQRQHKRADRFRRFDAFLQRLILPLWTVGCVAVTAAALAYGKTSLPVQLVLATTIWPCVFLFVAVPVIKALVRMVRNDQSQGDPPQGDWMSYLFDLVVGLVLALAGSAPWAVSIWLICSEILNY